MKNSRNELSSDVADFFDDIWVNIINKEMPDSLNKEIYEECKICINENGGFPESPEIMHKGWSFLGALFAVLYTDQKIQLYREALEINPSNSRLWKLVGLEYFNLNMFDSAIECLIKAIEIGIDGNPNATYELIGSSYAKLENADLAETWCSKSDRFNISFVKSNYGSIANYGEIAFKREPKISPDFNKNI